VSTDRFRNPDGTYDGVGMLGALSGQSREQVAKAFERIREQHKQTAACALHQLKPTGEKHKQWRCESCGWEPEAGQTIAYEQGLQHGRAHATGGGRGEEVSR
jgi:ribosomal protein L37AE/L43A